MIGELPYSHVTTPPPSSMPKYSNLPAPYYALVAVGSAAIMLALYNLVVIRCCGRQQGGIHGAGPTSNPVFLDDAISNSTISSFKYKKDGFCGNNNNDYDHECAVCLSVYEEGEDLRQLGNCKHSFLASYIDMWLFSRMDCPLCRSPIDPLVRS